MILDKCSDSLHSFSQSTKTYWVPAKCHYSILFSSESQMNPWWLLYKTQLRSFFVCFLATPQGILVPWPGIQPAASAVRTLGLHHWTTTGPPAKSFTRKFYILLTTLKRKKEKGIDLCVLGFLFLTAFRPATTRKPLKKKKKTPKGFHPL